MTTAEAVSHLTEQLKADPDYREAWKANIAMAFKDTHTWHKRKPESKSRLNRADAHTIANDAAEYFLKSLCGEIKYPTGR